MDWIEHSTQCPACGALISLLVDEANLGAEYVEDCEVCCRPLLVSPSLDSSGALLVAIAAEGS